ncbi:MAG: potassium transporter TrkG [Nitriliruptorales bacterium]|nr:potassium transporter TrkG [Nitriliruptorales bacterium]
MLIRPDRDDFRTIGFYVGKVLTGVGVLLLLPLVFAVPAGDWNSATALLIGAAIAIIVGRTSEALLFTRQELDWSHGLVSVAVSWLLGPLFVAIPLFLSGHFASYLDAYFDAMSGLTTSGLATIQDLDHLSRSMNLLRHLTHFAGGQGIVIVVLTMFATSGAQVGTLYVAEGRDERIVPNVVRTARFIYGVALAYAVVGTAALTWAASAAGLRLPTALYHGFNLFMAAFDTGGFSPMSSSIAYYHSAALEMVVMVLMIAGTLSFGLHFALWRGRRRELWLNLETRTLAVTVFGLLAIVLTGLAHAGAYERVGGLFRKGAFTLLSAHTGTGFSVTSGRLFSTEWGLIAPAGIVMAMALGGMASSTAGGIKAIRVGITVKSVVRDIRRLLVPESALVVSSYHSNRRQILRDSEVRGAITVLVLFLLSYGAGAILGVYYGFQFEEALFESTSAAANVGLSIGVLSPDLATPLKVTYLIQMWLGRLEFMTAFAFIGYLAAMFRGRL